MLHSRLRDFGLVAFSNLTEFAKALNMSQPSLSQYLNDKRSPGTEIFTRMYELGCSVDWLLSGNGSMFANNAAGNMLKKKLKRLQSVSLELK